MRRRSHFGKRASAIWTVAALAWGGCSEPPAPQTAPQGPDPEFVALYQARDPFALRERFQQAGEPDHPVERLYLAWVEHAFNRPEMSNRQLAKLPAAELPPELAFEAGRLRVWNHVRRFEYAQALKAAEEALGSATAAADAKMVADLENESRLLAALADVPPQRVIERGRALLSYQEEGLGRRVPVTIATQPRGLLLDTGANFSVLMRSEAESLGLEIREVGLEVDTSTEIVVTADAAVAPSFSMGPSHLENVVFLVLPDELLSFPEAGVRIPGILGLPVIEALGGIRFRESSVEIGAETSGDREPNLALDQLHPLIRVRWGGEAILCALDTGANHTAFYEPFYRRYRSRIDVEGERQTIRVGGVGGIQELETIRLPETRIAVGGFEATLHDANVYVRSTPNDDGVRDCNLGQDVLSQAAAYLFDFHAMVVVLEEAAEESSEPEPSGSMG